MELLRCDQCQRTADRSTEADRVDALSGWRTVTLVGSGPRLDFCSVLCEETWCRHQRNGTVRLLDRLQAALKDSPGLAAVGDYGTAVRPDLHLAGAGTATRPVVEFTRDPAGRITGTRWVPPQPDVEAPAPAGSTGDHNDRIFRRVRQRVDDVHETPDVEIEDPEPATPTTENERREALEGGVDEWAPAVVHKCQLGWDTEDGPASTWSPPHLAAEGVSLGNALQARLDDAELLSRDRPEDETAGHIAAAYADALALYRFLSPVDGFLVGRVGPVLIGEFTDDVEAVVSFSVIERPGDAGLPKTGDIIDVIVRPQIEVVS